MEMNRDVAKRVLTAVDAGLVSGLGEQIPGKMCVEAAVCYAMGLPHGDEPHCVGSAVRRFKIDLNDSRWPDDMARAAGMRKLAVAQLGSDQIDQRQFDKVLAFKAQRVILPMLLRRAASFGGKFATELEAMAITCDSATTEAETIEATKLARELTSKSRANANAYASANASASAYANANAYASANASASAYANANAYASAYASAYAYAYASAYANAYAYANANAYAYASAYANANASDYAYAYANANAYANASASANASANAKEFRHTVLKAIAQIGLEALIELKSPGCEWLDLCEPSDGANVN